MLDDVSCRAQIQDPRGTHLHLWRWRQSLRCSQVPSPGCSLFLGAGWGRVSFAFLWYKDCQKVSRHNNFEFVQKSIWIVQHTHGALMSCTNARLTARRELNERTILGKTGGCVFRATSLQRTAEPFQAVYLASAVGRFLVDLFRIQVLGNIKVKSWLGDTGLVHTTPSQACCLVFHKVVKGFLYLIKSRQIVQENSH